MSPAGVTKDMGPCHVKWDEETSDIDLNPTRGGVVFKDEVLQVEVKEDQEGETPVDAVHTGRIVELTIPMTRSTLNQLEAAIKGSVEGASNLKVSNKVGVNVFPLAKEIVIKPIEDGIAAANTTWLYIHRCYPFSNLEWGYDNENQRVTNVVFKAYPDDKTGRVGEMWRIGPA